MIFMTHLGQLQVAAQCLTTFSSRRLVSLEPSGLGSVLCSGLVHFTSNISLDTVCSTSH